MCHPILLAKGSGKTLIDHLPTLDSRLVTLYLYMYSCTRAFVIVQWLEVEFLGYLDRWETSVRDRPGLSRAQQNNMLLSPETCLGLRTTGKHYHTNDSHVHYPSSEVVRGSGPVCVHYSRGIQ